MKFPLEAKNYFPKSILEMVRLMHWYSNEKESSKKKQILKRKKKGQ
jgi:hypothetical protein